MGQGGEIICSRLDVFASVMGLLGAWGEQDPECRRK